MKPFIHAKIDARELGGEPDDYIEIHELMDSSKSSFSDNRHRAMTHNSWFIAIIIPKIFGETFLRKSDGKEMSSRDIAERHCLQDYKGFIPTAQDFLGEMEYMSWMNNGRGKPNSCRKTPKNSKTKIIHD